MVLNMDWLVSDSQWKVQNVKERDGMVFNATLGLFGASLCRVPRLKFLDSSKIWNFDVVPDVECMMEEVEVECLLLPLLQIPSHPSNAVQVHGIVIRPVDASAEFYGRVGYFSFDSSRSFVSEFLLQGNINSGKINLV